MVESRGGIDALHGVFRRIVVWSDFCHSNVWCYVPTFPHSSPVLDLSGIFALLRSLTLSLSYLLTPQARLMASTQIADIEYSLLALNEYPELLPSVRTAARLWLYLVIRELPEGCAMIGLLTRRLRDQLKTEDGEMGMGIKRLWIWMMFVGWAAASSQNPLEGEWFGEEVWNECLRSGIDDINSLRQILKGVLWQDEWCETRCARLWDEIMGRDRYNDNFELSLT